MSAALSSRASLPPMWEARMLGLLNLSLKLFSVVAHEFNSNTPWSFDTANLKGQEVI